MKKAISILISISLLAAYGHYHGRGRTHDESTNFAHSRLNAAVMRIDAVSTDPARDRLCPACSLLNSYKILGNNHSLILFVQVPLQIRIFPDIVFTDKYQQSSDPTRAPPILS